MLARSMNSSLKRISRSINQCSVRYINHDGEAYSKSNLNLLTKEDDGHTYIEAFSPIGFRLSSGLRILGPCALFPKSVLHWNIASAERITPDSLCLFSMLDPKPDILIIGIGSQGSKYDKNIVKYLRSKRINVEILPTEQACSTFNFLNAERRVVAAALIPPLEVEGSADNMVIGDMDEFLMSRGDQQLEEPGSLEADVSRTMERFRDEGMMKTITEMDKRREREREERDSKTNNGDGDGQGGKDSR